MDRQWTATTICRKLSKLSKKLNQRTDNIDGDR